MRLVFVVVVALLATASAYVDVTSPRGYHEDVGIPLAEKIRVSEEQAQVTMARLPTTEDRVVGGVISHANAHPYFAGMLINFVNIAGQSVCGSSLLSNTRLVTAAHCWFDGVNQASMFTVILGSNFLWSGGLRIATRQVFMHPQWTPWNLSNDVAMIYLPFGVTFTTNIQPIRLPSDWELTRNFVGEWGTAAGFGKTSDSQVGASTVVSHVKLRVITVPQCRSVFGPNFIFDSTLCTSGEGSVGVCGGDSGGPLYVNRGGRHLLIGISSFVAHNNCEGGHPSAFARVTSFINFINQHM